jgi:DNA polymerase III subunit delta'
VTAAPAGTPAVAGGVWADIVGQRRVVEQLGAAAVAAREVVAGRGPGVGMTHAWLLTGPPGSGRSTAAIAFAAALQCTDPDVVGCGRCHACRTVLGGSHPDVQVVRPPGLHHLTDNVRELVLRSALSPSSGRWQVVVMEDADRLEGPDLAWRPANALLKAIEEPAPRTVWVLCAPSLEDVLPTIRSRCRQIGLVTPPAAAVAEVLVRRDGVDPATAAFAARVAQSHVGRARRLALDEASRLRRAEVLRIPAALVDIGSCLVAAANLVDAADEEAVAQTAERDAAETEALAVALGQGSSRGLDTQGRAQLKDLERLHKRRATRTQRDLLDIALLDLAGFYRDVLTVQVGAPVDVANVDVAGDIRRVAEASTPERSVERIEAVLACRAAVAGNVAPLLAVEALTLALR